MSYYPQPDSSIRDKVKVLLDLSNYGTNKESEQATDVVTPKAHLVNFSLVTLS